MPKLLLFSLHATCMANIAQEVVLCIYAHWLWWCAVNGMEQRKQNQQRSYGT